MLRERQSREVRVDEATVLVAAALVLVWSVTARRLSRADMSGPILFLAAGLVLANGPTGVLEIDVADTQVHQLAEVTLVLLLFADASRVDLGRLRSDAGLPLRLLLVALPLCFAAGTGVALAVAADLPWQLGALIGAVLAPTDAALSAAVVADERVPRRVRRAINVESGLNDGLATPVVTFLIAASAVQLGQTEASVEAAADLPHALGGLAGGVVLGAALGWLGARAIEAAHRRDWMTLHGARIAALALPVMAFAGAGALDANHFVAAFVTGLVFGTLGDAVDDVAELPELLGETASLVVWFIFGATLLLPGLEHLDWRGAVVAVAALTVVRMVPVALALLGTGVDRATTAFLGWFGPRGLASVVFLLLAVDALPDDDPAVRFAVAAITATIALSVVAHGVSAQPLSSWLAERAAPEATGALAGEPERRRRLHHHGATTAVGAGSADGTDRRYRPRR